MNVAAFFHVLSLVMYAMNAANIRKPIRLYMPEHAMSMAKGIVDPSGLVMVIVGFPYSPVRVDGTPNVFMMVWLASELMTDRVEPMA